MTRTDPILLMRALRKKCVDARDHGNACQSSGRVVDRERDGAAVSHRRAKKSPARGRAFGCCQAPAQLAGV